MGSEMLGSGSQLGWKGMLNSPTPHYANHPDPVFASFASHVIPLHVNDVWHTSKAVGPRGHPCACLA